MRKILLVAAAIAIVGATGAWLFYRQTGTEQQQPSQAKTAVETPAPAAGSAAPVDAAQSQSAPAAPAAAQTAEPAPQAPAATAPSAPEAKKTKAKAKSADHKAKSHPDQ